MKQTHITRNSLAIICLLTASLSASLLVASTQENEKKTAKPREVGIKAKKQEKPSVDDKESGETDEQMAIRIRQQKLQSMIEEVIARLSQIEPIETRIIAHIETAATLWKYDRQRAYRLIEQGIELLDSLDEKKMDSSLAVDSARHRF